MGFRISIPGVLKIGVFHWQSESPLQQFCTSMQTVTRGSAEWHRYLTLNRRTSWHERTNRQYKTVNYCKIKMFRKGKCCIAGPSVKQSTWRICLLEYEDSAISVVHYSCCGSSDGEWCYLFAQWNLNSVADATGAAPRAPRRPACRPSFVDRGLCLMHQWPAASHWQTHGTAWELDAPETVVAAAAAARRLLVKDVDE